MANQIVVSAGAKVRNLDGVLTGTSGVVNSLPINASNGIPQLDVNGKILVSQLPNSVMEYKGTWNVSTNTPTLVNGTGNQGDVFLVEGAAVGGTSFNFGAGGILFFNGDQAIYSGSIWQRASGATGTVTSVAVTESGDSLNITGSPIVNSGTINIGFNGTNLQYVNGAGNLTTFPDLSVYVTLAGAQTITGSKTFSATLYGTDSEFSGSVLSPIFSVINGTKVVNLQSLATLNRDIYLPDASGTIALTSDIPILTGYVPYTGATADVDLDTFKLNAQSIHAKGTGGLGHFGMKHQSASATASANEVSLFADSLGDFSWLNGNLYLSKFITSSNTAARSYTFPDATGTVALTSDLTGYLTAVTATYPLSSSGGTTPNITIPLATAITDGYLSDTDWFVFNSKQAALSGTGFVKISGTTISYDNSTYYLASNPNGYTSNVGTVTSVGLSSATSGVTIGSSPITTSGTITLAIATATDFQNGLLSSTDRTAFNNKQDQFTVSSPLTFTSLNLAMAAATTSVNGYLSSADWTTFNNKQGTITLTTTGTSGAATFTSNTLNIPNYGSALSAYLPLTGGTLTGALSGTSATFTNSAITTSVLYTNNNSSGAQHYQDFGNGGGFVSGRILRGNGASGLEANGLNIDSYAGFKVRLNQLGGSGGSFTIDGGNVGIGTSSPDALLEVENASNPSIFVTNTGAATLRIQAATGVVYIGSKTADALDFITGDTPRMRITSGGNVGIGTSSPNAPLTIYNASIPYMNLKNANSGTYGMVFGFTDSNGNAELWNYDNGFLRFATNGAERMRITSAGRLLINTPTESTYQLDVNGTGRFLTTSTPPLTIQTTGGNNGIIMLTASTKVSWLIGAQYNVDQSFEITPSTANGGTTFSAPALKIASTGAATFSSTINSGAITSTGLGTLNLKLNGGNSNIQLWSSDTNPTQRNWTISQSNLAYADLGFYQSNALGGDPIAAGTARMYLSAGGNVLIGTTTNTNHKLTVYNATSASQVRVAGAAPSIVFTDTVTDPATYVGYIGMATAANNFITGAAAGDYVLHNYSGGPILFGINNSEKMRITSGGFLKASNTGNYFNAASYHELRANTSGNWVTYMTNTASTDPYGLIVNYTGASPNGSVNEFFYAYDTLGGRFGVRSNGGIANYQANDVNLSDIRTKKDIIPLESYWDKFKAIEIVKFKYKDQTHDDFNIGVIAQQVESVAPEFIDTDGFGEIPKDGIPLKTVYTADLHHATIRVLQECMVKIEEQQAQIEELKLKIK